MGRNTLKQTRPGQVFNEESAILFLEEAEKYFLNRPTNGEDRNYWANIYNAENCRKIINLLLDKTD